jgi:hypothetical protein
MVLSSLHHLCKVLEEVSGFISVSPYQMRPTHVQTYDGYEKNVKFQRAVAQTISLLF